MNTDRVELLAPAGNFETMIGAFNAGADAVYLGGSKFGARAYADNFDAEQVLNAISYARKFDKKIYMTVNTLVKENEYDQLYDFMLPFAREGLHGVIVQDFGVIRFIREHFPDIELHASTQQSLTGIHAAQFLKDLGCCRIVPARELSLYEIGQIKENVDIDIEAFIHGAMCYCYSGACLYSSMVGGRSGNRGRCAQPCRLPMRADLSDARGREEYPLSLKDMCTIENIPDLLRAGINSFKIEGRMKKPEYAAGVTSVYRKYIDKYYENPSAKIKVSNDDYAVLKGLYLRTGTGNGYYYMHNGPEMVTLSKPGYNGTDEKVVLAVHDQYLKGQLKKQLDIYCNVAVGHPLEVTAICQDVSVSVSGGMVSEALNKPMTAQDIQAKLTKFGNTDYQVGHIEINMNEGEKVFVPVKEINECRRQIAEKLDASFGDRTYTIRDNSETKDGSNRSFRPASYSISVTNKDQLNAAIDAGDMASRIIVDLDLIRGMDSANEFPYEALKSKEIVIALPYITREEKHNHDIEDLEWVIKESAHKQITGVLVRNVEQAGFLKDNQYPKKLIYDYGMYTWNHGAVAMYKEQAGTDDLELSVPLELTTREAKAVCERVDSDTKLSSMIYGYIPMMITAGCVRKTYNKCSQKMYQLHTDFTGLTDRMNNHQVVMCRCRNCYNIIYNSVPLSLHNMLQQLKDEGMCDYFRIDFSYEDYDEASKVLSYFAALAHGASTRDLELPYDQFTTGHAKRGVE